MAIGPFSLHIQCHGLPARCDGTIAFLLIKSPASADLLRALKLKVEWEFRRIERTMSPKQADVSLS